MVVAGEGIRDDNWEEKLLASDATFKHHSPYGDPGGYRAVMAILLADAYRPGLSDRLMNHPGHMGMEKDPVPPGKPPQARYEFTYYTGAKASGKDYAELPAVMNLSDASLAEVYANARFAVDDENTVSATPIAHALAIPKAAANKEAAKEFARMFLSIDKAAYGFLPRDGVFGRDPLL